MKVEKNRLRNVIYIAVWAVGANLYWGCGGPREVANPSFRDDVRPIIANFCKCHASEHGQIPYLGTRMAIVGSDLPIPMVNSAAPEESYMIQVLTAHGRVKMPPGPNALPPEMVGTLRNWIRNGAPDN